MMPADTSAAACCRRCLYGCQFQTSLWQRILGRATQCRAV